MFKKLTNLFKRAADTLGVTPAPEFPTPVFVGICKKQVVEVPNPNFKDVDFYKLSFSGADKTHSVGYRVSNNMKQLLVFNGKRVHVIGLGKRVPNKRVHDLIKSHCTKG